MILKICKLCTYHAAILGMKRVGGKRGDKIINQRVNEIDDNRLYNKYFQNSKKKGKVDKTSIAAMIKEVMEIKEPTIVDEEELVCLIGFYMCCVLFFGDINASSIQVEYLGLVETLETVKKVSRPYIIHEHLFDKIIDNVNVAQVKGCVPYLLILFVEHTPKDTIPKVHNREAIFPRVRR
ncbi:hypothetical protein MKX01_021684 [Papaver californicum]|nr:hypothetical protein MKX01_021684 [Papaver californicum]